MNRKVLWVMDGNHDQIMGIASNLGERKTDTLACLDAVRCFFADENRAIAVPYPDMPRPRPQKFLSARKCTLDPDRTITSAAAGISCRYRRVHKFEAAGHVGKLQIWQKRYCRTAGE